MQFNLKNYQKNKTISILKKNNFLFFAIGANQNSHHWITLEQNLYNLKFSYKKTFNKALKKILKKSIIKNVKNLISSTMFFLKPKNNKKTKLKNKTINTLNETQFTILILKLNKKLYSTFQFKFINSFHYKKNISITYQFLLLTLKSATRLKLQNSTTQ